MIWRFDIAHDDDVRAHAGLIFSMIKGGAMPRPGTGQLTGEQIHDFELWMEEGYPP